MIRASSAVPLASSSPPTPMAAPTALFEAPTRTVRILLMLLGLLALSVPVYVFFPFPEPLHEWLYVAIAATAVLIGFLGLLHHRPERLRGWFLILLGCAGWVIGDLVWTLEQSVFPNHYPAPSDGVYLASYLALGGGALVIVRARGGGRDLAALLDAAIITTGAGILVGVFLIAPLAADSDLSLAAKSVSSAYPLADLFLIGVLARMYAGSGARTTAYRLLTGSLVFTLIADVGYEVEVLLSGDTVSTELTDGAWLIGYLLAASAACVPSMKCLVQGDPQQAETAPSRRRLAGLTGGGLILPGLVLLLDGMVGHGIHWPAIGVGTLLLCALVLVRMVGLLNVVQVQAGRLSALAHSDYLTGAPNRRTWDDELPRAAAISREHATVLCVAILDLDRFKAYNDTHGHQAGDDLLREAVTAWTKALPPDALLARYGGEEFAILIPGSTPDEVARTLHRLRAVTPGGQTFSAGVALWDPATTPGTAVAGADQALYAAKRAGRDRVVVHGREPALERELAALGPVSSRPLPPFTILTQPIVDLRSLQIVSHEALARFTGPAAETEVPEVFRQAHGTGDGDLLELAVILAALALPGRSPGQDLYVNASARAVTSRRFLAGLPSSLAGVVIELCEDPEDVDLTRVAASVQHLRSRGARIALDDVGAGAQEFARLAVLRPDIIKVDRSLVTGCAQDQGCTAVLHGLVTYAGDLGLTVCAEGVEDVADLQHLTALGIAQAQGYLLARPSTQWQNTTLLDRARLERPQPDAVDAVDAVAVDDPADPEQAQPIWVTVDLEARGSETMPTAVPPVAAEDLADVIVLSPGSRTAPARRAPGWGTP